MLRCMTLAVLFYAAMLLGCGFMAPRSEGGGGGGEAITAIGKAIPAPYGYAVEIAGAAMTAIGGAWVGKKRQADAREKAERERERKALAVTAAALKTADPETKRRLKEKAREAGVNDLLERLAYGPASQNGTTPHGPAPAA